MVTHYDAALAAIPVLSGGGFVAAQFTSLPLAVAGLVGSLLVILYEMVNPPTDE